MIVDFLKLDLPHGDMAAALRVVRAFKECESGEEWFAIPFPAWAKLEQLEEFLSHRVEGTALNLDTIGERFAASVARAAANKGD